MLSIRTIASMALVASLSACSVVPMRISLAPQQRAAISELKAHVIVVQDEVIAAVQPSNVSMATGGGLIGAMIDSSITNSRVKASQEVLGPFYAQIEDVDYRKEFNEAIGRSLARYPIKVAGFTTTPRALSMDDLKRMRNQLAPGQALLVVYPRYFLTMDFRTLDAESVVTMWTKDGDDRVPVQRAVLYYQSSPVGSGGQDSVTLWGAQNAATFRATLRESIAETIDLFLLDLELDSAAVAAKAPAAQTFGFNTGASQGTIQARLVKEDARRVTVLGVDNKLYSLPKEAKQTVAAQH